MKFKKIIEEIQKNSLYEESPINIVNYFLKSSGNDKNIALKKFIFWINGLKDILNTKPRFKNNIIKAREILLNHFNQKQEIRLIKNDITNTKQQENKNAKKLSNRFLKENNNNAIIALSEIMSYIIGLDPKEVTDDMIDAKLILMKLIFSSYENTKKFFELKFGDNYPFIKRELDEYISKNKENDESLSNVIKLKNEINDLENKTYKEIKNYEKENRIRLKKESELILKKTMKLKEIFNKNKENVPYKMVNQKNIQNVIKNNKDYYEEIAKKNKVSVEELKEKCNSNLKRILVNAIPRIRVPSQALPLIIKSQRYVSQFESNFGSGGDGSDNSRRISVEKDLYDVPKNIDVSKRPVYGYLADDKKYSEDNASMYGSVILELNKEAIKNRMTFLGDDSFDEEEDVKAPSMFNDPKYYSVRKNVIEDLYNNKISSIEDLQEKSDSSYIEIQIHNALLFDSNTIKQIVFTLKPPSKKIIEKLTELNIKWIYKKIKYKNNDALL